MQTEIQNLIDHPEAIRDTLNTDQLDRLIGEVTGIRENITMRYSISEGRSNARFDAESEQDLVGSSGIFSKVLVKCRIETFSSSLTYTPEDGFAVWFILHLSYQHFDGGENGMNIASFRFKNGEWTVGHYKGENRRDGR